MIFKIRIGHWRITFTIAPVVDIIGVNSKLPNGAHILMWDFDNVHIANVQEALGLVQREYNLSNIYILSTGQPKHYIAYCFQQRPWEVAVAIIASTLFVDRNFFKYGVYRGHFTLRVSPKQGRKIKLKKVLASFMPETCTVEQLESWTRYETLADSAPMSKREWKVGRK